MRTILVVSLSMFFAATAQAQQKEKTDAEDGVRDILRATFLAPGISYEKRIGNFHTILGGVTVVPGAVTRSAYITGHSETDFYIQPGGFFQYRYYYNYKKRSERGRSTENNSANYIGPIYEFAWTPRPATSDDFIEDKARAQHTLGFVWGMQRNFKKRFSLVFEAGPGYLSTTRLGGRYTYESVTIVSHFSLGFWLNKRAAE